MSSIGKKISDARKLKGLTQETLAELSKVNLRTIQRIENNESTARGKTLLLICDVLDIDIEKLLSDEIRPTDLFNKNDIHGYKLASKGTRLLANLVEFLIYLIIIFTPYVLFIKIILKKSFSQGDLFTFEFSAAFGLTVGAIFYPLFKGNLGHRIFGLKVIHANTGKDFNTAADGGIRELLKWVLSIFLIPIIWILWDDKNQNLYDKLTKTLVVEK